MCIRPEYRRRNAGRKLLRVYNYAYPRGGFLFVVAAQREEERDAQSLQPRAPLGRGDFLDAATILGRLIAPPRAAINTRNVIPEDDMSRDICFPELTD